MNDIMKKIFTVLAALMITTASFAQIYGDDDSNVHFKSPTHIYRQIYSINWQAALPVGSSSDFLSKMSFNGMNVNFAFFINDYIAVGADFSWNYNQKLLPPTAYYLTENIGFYASLYKTTQCFPLKAQFKYIINPEGFAKVYLAAGLGATSYTEATQIQDYQVWNSSWGFLMSPEVGVLIPFGKNAPWGANITAGYNWATNHAQNVYFNVGLFFAVY